MGNDSRMLEMKSVGTVDENREENELMLELSIGGIFAKSKKTIQNVSESMENDKPEEDLNVHSKREIQALRRRELRRKREEKLKKSVGIGSCGSVSGPFVENKDWLEKQIGGQNDEVLEVGFERARKKERIGNVPENVASIPTAPITNGFLNPNGLPVCGGGGEAVAHVHEDLNTKNSSFQLTACRNFKPYQGNLNQKAIEHDRDDGVRRNSKVNSNGSPGYASSAVSDSQCSSRQGGATDESRSNSSNSQVDHQPATTSAASDPSDQPIASPKPSLPTLPEQQPSPANPNDRLKNSFFSSHPALHFTERIRTASIQDSRWVLHLQPPAADGLLRFKIRFIFNLQQLTDCFHSHRSSPIQDSRWVLHLQPLLHLQPPALHLRFIPDPRFISDSRFSGPISNLPLLVRFLFQFTCSSKLEDIIMY
ncbi:hypothetical protein LXL04_036756 [Taraxacum kok-saghyz]